MENPNNTYLGCVDTNTYETLRSPDANPKGKYSDVNARRDCMQIPPGNHELKDHNNIISLVWKPALFENKYISILYNFILNLFILVLPSFKTYHRICNQSFTTGATRGAGIVYPFRSFQFTSVLVKFDN
jgi:hypothetical protein